MRILITAPWLDADRLHSRDVNDSHEEWEDRRAFFIEDLVDLDDNKSKWLPAHWREVVHDEPINCGNPFTKEQWEQLDI